MAERAGRVSIGFAGGQVLAVRVVPDALQELRGRLGSGGWHELRTDEGVVQVNLDQVVYVNVDSDEHRVGFG